MAKAKKIPTVNYADLIRLVAKDCSYFPYEVEDVLYSLARVIHEQVADNHMRVRIEHLVTIEPSKIESPMKYNFKTKQQELTSDILRVKFRTMPLFKERLRANREKRNTEV